MAIDKIQSESINLADTFAFTGTVTGAGGVNSPIVMARNSSSQSISSSTETEVVFDTEVLDTSNAFSSNEFTCPSGQAGKYFVGVTLITSTGASLQRMYIKKNGSTNIGYGNFYDFGSNDNTFNIQTIIDLSVGDTVKVIYFPYQASGTIRSNADYQNGTQIHIFKLI